ncbi:MAG: ester cyclase [Proteobacteria bacterium]|nr:ester cyclase [Pseudomonadota bacterium]
MRRAEIETLARRWIGFWRDGSLEGLEDAKADDFFDRSAAGHDADRAGLKAEVSALHRAFPDLEAVADSISVDVALGVATIRWTATGRHEGEFLGVPPSGRRVSLHGIEVIRCSDGVVAERWGEWDEGAILTQLAGFPLAAE